MDISLNDIAPKTRAFPRQLTRRVLRKVQGQSVNLSQNSAEKKLSIIEAVQLSANSRISVSLNRLYLKKEGEDLVAVLGIQGFRIFIPDGPRAAHINNHFRQMMNGRKPKDIEEFADLLAKSIKKMAK